ncbi:aspartic peptidase domain-containing protein [Dichotomocladium elegans]|nr:aspartic peptidase domain-containing protein [Dichotomocladium elegans]
MRYTFVCLAALAQLALSVCAAEPQPVRIPLFRRTNKGVATGEAQTLDNGVLGGKIYIGTPPQEFTVAFDTTTGYSWVRGSRCKTENCLDRCTYYARRSESAVSTGVKFNIDYGDACVDTYVYLDNVTWNGVTTTNMPFGGAYRMSGFDHGFDGYLGLGRAVDFNHTKIFAGNGNLAKRDELPSSAFVTNAYQQGNIESAQFGLVTTTTDSGFAQGGVTTDPNAPSTNPTDPNANNPITPSNSTAPANSTIPSAPVSQAAPPAAPTSDPNANSDPNVNNQPVTSGGFGFVKRTNHEEQPAGYLVLGGVDKTLIEGDIEYIPLSDPVDGNTRNWDLCIKDANFKDVLNIKQKPNAIASVSTSSGFITMPSDQADIFEDVFGLKYYSSSQTYAVKCSEIANLPTLKLTLENHIVELPPKYWTRVIDADRDCCVTSIRRGVSTRDWVLGTPFTNAFYTTFDPDTESVGLGIKKGHKDDGLAVYRKSKTKKHPPIIFLQAMYV